MTRILLTYLLPLLLPTVIYFLYMMWARKRAHTAGSQVPNWWEGPIYWFVLTGLILVGAVMVTFLVSERESGIGKAYEPSRVEDGRLVPGQFRSTKPPAD